MMNLLDILKQFKNIEPDHAYSQISKRAILAMDNAPRASWTARRTLFRLIETGIAVSLAGFFVFLITGGLSGSNAPVQYMAIDPQSLRAEAQAIDIQIQLANVTYLPSSDGASTLPVAGGASTKSVPLTVGEVKTASPTTASGTIATTTDGNESSSTLSLDQALEGLSK